MQLSGGPYSYNRFDSYENSLEENRMAAMSAGESEGKSMMKDAGKPAKVTGGKTHVEMGKDGKPLFKEGVTDASENETDAWEAETGGDGSAEDFAAWKKKRAAKKTVKESDEMEEGYKPLPTEKMSRQSNKAYAKEVVAAKHGKEKEANKQMQRRIAMNDPKGRKAVLSKEELNSEETTETVMENRMAMYSRALGVMGAHYSGPGFGVSPIEEKKADKDYDGDGKVESSKEEYFGSKDKAIKKAMKNEEASVEEGFKPFPKAKVQDKAAMKPDTAKGEKQARNMDNARMAHTDKDIAPIAKGAVKEREQDNKKKGLEKRFAAPSANKNKNKAYQLEGQRRRDLDNRVKKEETEITKEMVIEYLVTEGYASNEVSAEILHTHISDEFLENIEEEMLTD
tara:strand:- start:23638 stop:24828 length:1191 start_codon:yes stop_codon:yes gene_type:complete